MTARMDADLRAAFEAASEFVEPPAGLAHRIQLRARKRRRRTLTASVSGGVVCVLLAAVLTHIAAGNQPLSAHRDDGVRIELPPGDQVTQLAASGPYLYVLSGQDDALLLYDRGSGQFLRRLSVPATDLALTIGPGGLVWLTFDPDPATRQAGIWLLSPDLRLHSAGGPGVGGDLIVPVSRTTAWAPSQYGLRKLTMPTPGKRGRGTEVLQPGTGIGPPMDTAPGIWAGLLDGHVAVQVTDGNGFDSHLVLAGQAEVSFGGSPGQQVGFVASAGRSAWAQTFAVHGQNAASSGPLVRVDGALQQTTPAAILASRILARVTDVWATGGTVWVATAVAGHSLVCFSARSRNPLIVTLAVRGNITSLAAAGDETYLSTAPPHTYGTSITSYEVPGPCR